jgi:uncharacterized protein (TIGR02271 family)
MVDTGQADQILGGTVVDQDGDKIGNVGQLYTDNDTGQPTWVTVSTGWFGTSESFVPLNAASIEGDTIRVPYDKAKVKDAPNKEPGEPLSEQDEAELYRYYGLGGGTTTDTTSGYATTTGTDYATTTGTDYATSGTEAGYVASGTADQAVAGTAATGEYLTRSEEQLHVGTEQVQAGRARLRKYVVSENQTVTVPVSRQEVRVEREPIAPGETVTGADIGEATQDVVLTEERVVVAKEAVPVEKVRLATETVTDQQQVTEEVRKEQIEYDTDASGQTSTTGTTYATGTDVDSTLTDRR